MAEAKRPRMAEAMADRVPDTAWTAVWDDFLKNKVAQAELRASPFLHSLPDKLAAASKAPSLKPADAKGI